MCLISKWRFPKKAKEDIICYKILIEKDYGNNYITPYQGTIVDVTKPLKAKGLSITFRNNKRKEKGYIHVFEDLVIARATSVFLEDVVFRCIIPKGTLYHISSDYCSKQFCAKQIKFLEKL